MCTLIANLPICLSKSDGLLQMVLLHLSLSQRPEDYSSNIIGYENNVKERKIV